MRTDYDLFLSKIRQFYDLDNCTNVIRGSVRVDYTLERSARDYALIEEFLNPENKKDTISKIKQTSSLIDFIQYADSAFNNYDNSKLIISILNDSPYVVQDAVIFLTFGSTLQF